MKVIKAVKERWPEYVIEIVILVLGISIAFVLNERVSSARERDEKQLVLQSLIDEIELNQATLNEAKAYHDSSANNLANILEFLSASDLNYDSLDHYTSQAIGASGFPLQEENLNFYLSSNLHFSIPLKLRLATISSKIKLWNDFGLSGIREIDEFISRISDHFDISSSRCVNREMYSHLWFKNTIVWMHAEQWSLLPEIQQLSETLLQTKQDLQIELAKY